MATSTEIFLELKRQAVNGFVELSLNEFGSAFSQIQDLFQDLAFDIANIAILSDTENKFKIKASSKDFLFKKTLFKNESVLIEAEFTLLNDEIEILAICKLKSMPNQLSKLPGIIGDLMQPLDFIEVNDLVYILTTKDVTVINSETFPEYHNKKVNLKPGINLAGFIDLKNSGNVVSLITKPLMPVIGEGPYFMSWNMKDKIDIDFSLNLPRDIDIESLFKIKQPKLVLKPITPIQISIDGLFDLQIPPLLKVSVLGGFSYTTDGVRGKFNLDKVAEKIPAPFGFPGVHLTTLTLSAGISNGIANVGAEGDFYIGPDKPGKLSNKPGVPEFGGVVSNQYKFIFDAIPGKITPKFFYMYLDKLTIEEYIKALSDNNIALPSFLNKISIEQVMFHWCEPSLLHGEPKPDGTIGKPIFGLSGITNLFGHRTFTELNVEQSVSKGKLIADPIDIGNGLLKITGKGKGTPEKYKGATKVKPGGMEFAFNSKGKPDYFSFSTKIEILGLSGTADGKVGDKNITGSFKTNIAGILRDELTLNLNGNNFDIKTEIYAGIKGLKVSLKKLGTINLNTFLEGGFSAKFLDGQYSNKMKLHFKVAGVNFDLGELDIKVFDLKEIVKILEKQIIAAIQKIGDNILAWLKATFEGIIVFVGDSLKQIGEALKTHFKVTIEKAAELMKDAKYKVKQVGETLQKGFNATAKEVSAALKKAGYLANEVCQVLKDIFKLSDKLSAEILKGLKYTAKEIGASLESIYNLGDKATSIILRNLEFTGDDCAEVMKDVYKLSGEAATEALKVAGYPAKEIEKALGKIIPKLPKVSKPKGKFFGEEWSL